MHNPYTSCHKAINLAQTGIYAFYCIIFLSRNLNAHQNLLKLFISCLRLSKTEENTLFTGSVHLLEWSSYIDLHTILCSVFVNVCEQNNKTIPERDVSNFTLRVDKSTRVLNSASNPTQ